MYDNKIRLSEDVMEKANLIASEWGLKNARAAVEAVFRKYADDYLMRSHQPSIAPTNWSMVSPTIASEASYPARCEALSELDDLLGL
ncbi:hypothetical protein K9N68_28875 [Kovacikia minuta CCNUW1]|uniref:hypothetical protein n=1 Tax=Kovacikia minuta TaxID=2931930 RepID=UPI001CCDC091|nr:hypothetical protein [Kovacikia minuta]UBF25546.1 hypothetical protein K9N68_28875 [Kovacikia minuta CCNUW1]